MTLFVIVLGVPIMEVVLRNTFSFGLSWSHELVQMTVLWLTMIGAMVAVRESGHIRLDVLDRFLPDVVKKYTHCMANVFAAIVCLVFAIFSIQVILWEFTDGTPGIGILPNWVFVCIIPISGFVMGTRYIFAAISSIRQ